MPQRRSATASGVSRTASAGVYGLFLLSGAAALVYQVIWARWLGLVFGNTTTSISIILGAFMLGLALGSWAAGRVVRRLANPMRAYALLELGIGAFALAFPLATEGLGRLYAAVATTASPAAVTIGWRVALAFALLLVPTSLMGATLPLLTEHFRRDPRHGRVWRAGVLYAFNTIGAALGVIAASFVGIELIGVRATTIVAAGLNFLVAALGFALARRVAPGAAPAEPALRAPGRARTSFVAATALLALGLSGGLALGSEVLWTRTLQLVIGNSTYAFATLLVVYLVGVALGSAAFSGVVKRSRRLAAWLVVLLLGMGVWTLLASEGFGLLQALAADRDAASAGARLGFYARAAALLLPLALLSGGMFPAGTRLLEPDADDAGGEQVARAYAWNTVGAVAGSLVAGFVVAARFDFFQAVDLLAAGYALAALGVGALFLAGGALGRLAAAAIGLAALGVASYGLAQARDGQRFARGIEYANPELEVVFHRPGLQGVTTAIRRRGEPFASRLLVNGEGMTLKITDTKLMAHLPMLVHPDPKRVLVICFGMGTTFRSALSHGAEVTAVELVPEVLEAFPVFYGDAEAVIRDPNGRRVASDGRNFLALTRERFDVITVDPPPPVDAAGVTHLYSREFVALARQRLAPGGVFAHWIPFPNGGVKDVLTLRMLLATVAAEFPYVLAAPALNGVGVHVLGSERPIEVDLDAIAARIAAPAVAADLHEWQPVPLEFFARLGPLDALDFEVAAPRPMRVRGAGLDGVPPVTDDRPRLEFDLWRMARGAGSAHSSDGRTR